MNGLQGVDFGIVVGVHPEGNSIDVLMDNGGRLSNVQVMAMGSSDSTGLMDLPDVGYPLDEAAKWNPTAEGDRYIRAVIASYHGRPFCLGFLFPQITAMTFERTNFRVQRHASDVYSTINAQGDTEWAHPSGSFVRWAENPAHEDLTAKDYDGIWAIKQNTGSAPHMHIQVANAGAAVATIDVDPAGNIVISNSGTTTVNTTGATTINSEGATKVVTPSVTVDSPQSTFTGAVTVQGALTFESGMTGSNGSGGATVTIDGDATFSGTVTGQTDVIAGTISGKGHKHPGVQSGGSETDPPV
jgi:hypothetical protein